MDTLFVSFDDDRLLEALNRSEVIAFPTETVYGLGVRYDSSKAFDKLVEKVLTLFNRIPQYWGDLHLEIWQGIFSFGTHLWVKDKSPKESINKPENGELYCNTLLEIYPIFKEFIDEWGNQYALFRFCEAVGPNQYRGLLYEQ